MSNCHHISYTVYILLLEHCFQGLNTQVCRSANLFHASHPNCLLLFFSLFYEDGSLINRMHRCFLKWYILFMSVLPILYFIKNTETCAWSIQSERTQVSQELSQKLKKSPLGNKKKNLMGRTLKLADLTWQVSKLKWKKRKFTANENEWKTSKWSHCAQHAIQYAELLPGLSPLT